MSNGNKRFLVSLSFPGEHRKFVSEVAAVLAEAFTKELVLYDKFHEAELARPDLDTYLPNLYSTESELIVLFLCADYARKRWCNLEWRFIRQLISTAEQRRIMFLSFDGIGAVPELGILNGDGYVPIGTRPAKEIAGLIQQRLRINQGIATQATSSRADESAIRRRLFEAKTHRELQELLFQAQELDPTPEVKLLIADIERAIEKTLVYFANENRSFDISRILKYAPAQLIGREDETKLLDEVWVKVQNHEAKRAHVLTFVALGGEGKTSLVAKWAAELAAQDWLGCDAAFAWSFYSQGTHEQVSASSDLFLKEALTFFGDDADKQFAASNAGAFEKGQRLARIVGQRRSLLILDGLEPLQYASTSPTSGELKDHGVAVLLKGLAAANHGLCVVTTRYSLPELKAFWQTTAPEVRLLRLSRAAGVHLLKTLGVRGIAQELETLVEDVKGHALSLVLMGTYLRDAHGGDIRKRDLVKLEEANAEEENGHAFRVMVAYERAFEREGDQGKRALAVLRLLGLFDRPLTADCIDALLRAPAIPGFTELLVGLSEAQRNITFSRLENAKLLTVNRDGSENLKSLDSHPLLREYFARQLRAQQPDAWRIAHQRLYEHLCANTKEGDRPTLEDLQPLYQAVAHGCQAGLQQEACEKIYKKRILRMNQHYSWRKLGAFGSDLGGVACFFDQPWNRLSPSLGAFNQGLVSNQAALYLRALGRLAEALEPMRIGMEVAVKREDWLNVALSASNLSELELMLGDVVGAVEKSGQSVAYADRSSDVFHRMGNRTTHADALHQAGRRAEAEACFREAEQIFKEGQSDYPQLYSLAGFRSCCLLLAEAERAAWRFVKRSDTEGQMLELIRQCSGVSQRAEQTLKWAKMEGIPLDIALDHLTLGRAALYRAILRNAECGDAELAKAKSELEQAVDGFHRASTQEFIVVGLLTRAWLRRRTGALSGPESAQADLDEAWEIAERGPMRLFMADIHLYRARLFFRETHYPWNQNPDGTPRGPAADLAAAEKIINECGYHRRDEELADAKKAILG